MVAQTRLASSYGLLQMMYGTAVWRLEYPSTDPNVGPEDLNVTSTGMYYSLEHMKKMLISRLTSSGEENGNWPKGFEFYFKKYVWPEWNSDPTYPRIVSSNSQKFLPQNK